MTNKELVAKALDVATNYKTTYMWGMFGGLVTEARIVEKTKQYPLNYSAAKRAALRGMIGKGIYAFDCVGLIKGLLWGWNAGTDPLGHGGAKYKASPLTVDHDANTMINACKDVSTDFKKLVPGCVVWMQGHIGIYIGDGKVVEATPNWSDGVQVTACHNIGRIAGLNGRVWTKHGKLPFIEYLTEPQGVPTTVSLGGKKYPATIQGNTTVLTLDTLVSMLGPDAEIPLRAFAEAMGYGVNFSSVTKTTTLVKKPN